MRLAFLGPPGAGKGTLAAMFARKYGYKHISTGDVLRGAIAADTPLGKQAAGYVNAGQLVPQEIMGGLVRDSLRGETKVILDGYPRTLEQAEFLTGLPDVKIDAVVYVSVTEEEAVKRLSKRKVCEACGEVVGASFEGYTCGRCGGRLGTRPDDNPATITERYGVYKEHTAPLVDYYRRRGELIVVDGAGTPEEVLKRLEDALNGHDGWR